MMTKYTSSEIILLRLQITLLSLSFGEHKSMYILGTCLALKVCILLGLMDLFFLAIGILISAFFFVFGSLPPESHSSFEFHTTNDI